MAFSSLTVGEHVPREGGAGVLARARERASLIPDLLVEASRVATTVTLGWHGRRRRGVGDDFWQFRPYDPSEGMSRIDWRRSARDDTTFVRDQEWEAAHTVWVWADESPSMLFKSQNAQVSKQSRAIVLALALTEVLAKSGERVGWPGVTRPLAARNAAERVATALALAPAQARAPVDDLRTRNEIVLFSDFLDDTDTLNRRLDDLANRGVNGSLVQIIDPAEEVFPYSGRTQFRDPETGAKLTLGRAETLAGDYAVAFTEHKRTIRDMTRARGWNHVVHHTDRLASEALVALHMRLSDGAARAGAA